MSLVVAISCCLMALIPIGLIRGLGTVRLTETLKVKCAGRRRLTGLLEF